MSGCFFLPRPLLAGSYYYRLGSETYEAARLKIARLAKAQESHMPRFISNSKPSSLLDIMQPTDMSVKSESAGSQTEVYEDWLVRSIKSLSRAVKTSACHNPPRPGYRCRASVSEPETLSLGYLP